MLWLLVGILLIMVASLFGIIGFGIAKIWFKPQNNPHKCLVFIRGVDRPLKGYASDISDTAIAYLYGKDKKVIIVPNDYGYDYHYFRRILRLDSIGQLVATPDFLDKKLADSEKNDIIFELIKSHIGRDAIKAIQENGKQNIMAIVIIVSVIVAIIAGVFGFVLSKSMIKPVIIEKQIPSQNTTINQQLPPSTIIIGGEK